MSLFHVMSHADAARRLGMAEREILDVRLVDGGVAVQTHDGTWTLATDDDQLVFNIPAPVVPLEFNILPSAEAEEAIEALAQATRGRRKGA